MHPKSEKPTLGFLRISVLGFSNYMDTLISGQGYEGMTQLTSLSFLFSLSHAIY